MAFISRLINKRIDNLMTRFSSTQMDKQFDNDYPLESTGDHYRFFL